MTYAWVGAMNIKPLRLLTVVSALLTCSVAHAVVLSFSATLSGPAESPPNASPGVGTASLTYDSVGHTLRVQSTFSGLLGTTSASHIHSETTLPGVGTAGVATTTPSFVGFPLGVTAGTFDNTLDLLNLSSYNPAYVTSHGGTAASSETALMASIAAGTAYFNIHTSAFPNGEIRGFLGPVSTPDGGPTALMLLLTTGAMAVWIRVHRAIRA